MCLCAPPVNCGASNIRFLDCADARNTGSVAYLGSWVAEVTIATANGKLVTRFQALAGLFQRKRKARAMVKKFSPGSEFAQSRQCAKAVATLNRIEKEVLRIHKTYGQAWSPDCVGAFVVFNNEESRRRCLEDYGRFSLSQAEPLRFRQIHALTVVEAPDPSL